jgi:hypothetical protein
VRIPLHATPTATQNLRFKGHIRMTRESTFYIPTSSEGVISIYFKVIRLTRPALAGLEFTTSRSRALPLNHRDRSLLSKLSCIQWLLPLPVTGLHLTLKEFSRILQRADTFCNTGHRFMRFPLKDRSPTSNSGIRTRDIKIIRPLRRRSGRCTTREIPN